MSLALAPSISVPVVPFTRPIAPSAVGHVSLGGVDGAGRLVDARKLADDLRDAAVADHTQWSSRKPAIVQLHALCLRLIAAREQSNRTNPGCRYSKPAYRAFVLKLQQVAILMPESAPTCLKLLDENLTAYLDGAFGEFGYERVNNRYVPKAGAR